MVALRQLASAELRPPRAEEKQELRRAGLQVRRSQGVEEPDSRVRESPRVRVLQVELRAVEAQQPAVQDAAAASVPNPRCREQLAPLARLA